MGSGRAGRGSPCRELAGAWWTAAQLPWKARWHGNFWGKNGRKWWFLEREHGKRYVLATFWEEFDILTLRIHAIYPVPEVLETLSCISLNFIGPCSIKSQPIMENMGLTSKHVHIISKPRRRHRISPARKGTHLDWGKTWETWDIRS